VPLTIAPCRKLCAWERTDGSYEGLPLFACSACGTEWVRSEAWTPRNWDVSIPAAVMAELDGGEVGNADS
jgi:hypothetical protein